MRARLFIFLILFVDAAFLLYGIQSISISYAEAVTYFDEKNFIHHLTHFSTALLGQNDFALRLPFMLFHLGSILLIYKISAYYLKSEQDRLLSALIFTMLPGVTSAAILVNSASVVIFLTLLFLYLYLKDLKPFYLLMLPLLVWVDNAFITLYLALFIYGSIKKELILSFLSGVLMIASYKIYGFEFMHEAKVYFFNLFAVYSLIFSPLLFLCFFYALYRIYIKEEKSLIWYISFVAFLLSLVLSFRQMISIEDFAPFVVISTPIMLAMFLRSYRIRLPELRRVHKSFFILIIASLILNFAITHLNKTLYLFIENPSKHFAYKYHIAKELANELKAHHIAALMTDSKLQKRLKFYGITRGAEYALEDRAGANDIKSVTISYYKKVLKTYHVSKIHKN